MLAIGEPLHGIGDAAGIQACVDAGAAIGFQRKDERECGIRGYALRRGIGKPYAGSLHRPGKPRQQQGAWNWLAQTQARQIAVEQPVADKAARVLHPIGQAGWPTVCIVCSGSPSCGAAPGTRTLGRSSSAVRPVSTAHCRTSSSATCFERSYLFSKSQTLPLLSRSHRCGDRCPQRMRYLHDGTEHVPAPVSKALTRSAYP